MHQTSELVDLWPRSAATRCRGARGAVKRGSGEHLFVLEVDLRGGGLDGPALYQDLELLDLRSAKQRASARLQEQGRGGPRRRAAVRAQHLVLCAVEGYDVGHRLPHGVHNLANRLCIPRRTSAPAAPAPRGQTAPAQPPTLRRVARAVSR